MIHAVHADLRGGGIDARDGIRHRGREAEGVIGNRSFPQNGALAHSGRTVDHVAEYGSHTVRGIGYIVHGNIIHVEGESTVNAAVLTVPIAICAVLLGHVELKHLVVLQERGAVIRADVHADVMPARLLQLIHEARFGLPVADVGVAAGRTDMVAVGIHAVELGIDTQTHSLVGQVDPHTDGLGIFKDPGLSEVQRAQQEA